MGGIALPPYQRGTLGIEEAIGGYAECGEVEQRLADGERRKRLPRILVLPSDVPPSGSIHRVEIRR